MELARELDTVRNVVGERRWAAARVREATARAQERFLRLVTDPRPHAAEVIVKHHPSSNVDRCVCGHRYGDDGWSAHMADELHRGGHLTVPPRIAGEGW